MGLFYTVIKTVLLTKNHSRATYIIFFGNLAKDKETEWGRLQSRCGEGRELPPPTNNRKDTSTNRTNLTEHILDTSRRLKHLKGQEKSLSGRRKEKKRMEGWDMHPGRELKRGAVPASWEAPGSAGTERRLRGEHNPHLRQAEERHLHRLEHCYPARPGLRHVSAGYGQGLNLRVERTVHRKRTAVGCGQGLKGVGVCYGRNWGVFAEAPRPP